MSRVERRREEMTTVGMRPEPRVLYEARSPQQVSIRIHKRTNTRTGGTQSRQRAGSARARVLPSRARRVPGVATRVSPGEPASGPQL